MEKLNTLIGKAEEWFCSLGFILATALMFINVVLRYVFKAGLPWSEELIRYLIIWATFIGIGLNARKNAHVSIDFFAAFLSKKNQRYMTLFADLVSIVFCVMMIFYSFETVSKQMATAQKSPALQLPFYLVYFCLPLGFGLGALRFSQHFYLTFKEGGEQ
ncbi:MAG: hypothetical protein VR72_11240 [Clostridiaceae bacterium BRH_c20a]|nr:MAG: hypothetical protein VR72_11240 [Clostridiaceae bacterium BRH_c20a]